MITWRDAYNIGVKEVDQQHQELVVKLNEFLDACVNQQGKDKIEETLTFLKDYTVEHFQNEEAIMKKHNYPEFDVHKKEHEAFIKTVVELEGMIQSKGVTILSTLKLNRTLVDWLLNHISKNDVKIGQFIQAKGLV